MNDTVSFEWRPKMSDTPVTVRLPRGNFNIDQAHSIVADILNRIGCGGCFSGRDINFVNEVEFFVTPEANIAELSLLEAR